MYASTGQQVEHIVEKDGLVLDRFSHSFCRSESKLVKVFPPPPLNLLGMKQALCEQGSCEFLALCSGLY